MIAGECEISAADFFLNQKSEFTTYSLPWDVDGGASWAQSWATFILADQIKAHFLMRENEEDDMMLNLIKT